MRQRKYQSIRAAALTSVCPGFTIAWQAIMSELLGKGQCWDAAYRSLSTSNPTSSATSRWTASSRVSPTSTQINSGQPCSRRGDTDAHLWTSAKLAPKLRWKYLGRAWNLWVSPTIGIKSRVGCWTAILKPTRVVITQNRGAMGMITAAVSFHKILMWHITICKFYPNRLRKLILVNIMHVEIFREKCTNVCNLCIKK